MIAELLLNLYWWVVRYGWTWHTISFICALYHVGAGQLIVGRVIVLLVFKFRWLTYRIKIGFHIEVDSNYHLLCLWYVSVFNLYGLSKCSWVKDLAYNYSIVTEIDIICFELSVCWNSAVRMAEWHVHYTLKTLRMLVMNDWLWETH